MFIPVISRSRSSCATKSIMKARKQQQNVEHKVHLKVILYDLAPAFHRHVHGGRTRGRRRILPEPGAHDCSL